MRQEFAGNSGAKPAVRLFAGERALVWAGALGFVLSAFCAVWVMLFGAEVAPDGDISKAVSFNAALGIFLLSTAAILPYSGLGAKSKAFFRWFYISLGLYSYAAETVQHFRGVNPRFIRNGSAFDTAAGIIFGFVAILLIIFYVFLAVQYFRRKSYALHPQLVLSIRYAMIAVMFSFAAGIWISANVGRYTGGEGNIMWLHGLGFHALQVMPVIAWLAGRSSLSDAARRGAIHTAGIAYLAGLAAVGAQTALGLSMLEWSLLPVAAGASFLVSVIAGAWTLRGQSIELGRTQGKQAG